MERIGKWLDQVYLGIDRRLKGWLSLLVRTGLAFDQDEGPVVSRSINAPSVRTPDELFTASGKSMSHPGWGADPLTPGQSIGPVAGGSRVRIIANPCRVLVVGLLVSI